MIFWRRLSAGVLTFLAWPAATWKPPIHVHRALFLLLRIGSWPRRCPGPPSCPGPAARTARPRKTRMPARVGPPALPAARTRPWRVRPRRPRRRAGPRRRSSCPCRDRHARDPREAGDRAHPARTGPRSRALLARPARRPSRSSSSGTGGAVARCGLGGGASSKKPLGAGRSRPRVCAGPTGVSRLVVLGPTGVSRSGWLRTDAGPTGVSRFVVLGPTGVSRSGWLRTDVGPTGVSRSGWLRTDVGPTGVSRSGPVARDRGPTGVSRSGWLRVELARRARADRVGCASIFRADGREQIGHIARRFRADGREQVGLVARGRGADRCQQVGLASSALTWGLPEPADPVDSACFSDCGARSGPPAPASRVRWRCGARWDQRAPAGPGRWPPRTHPWRGWLVRPAPGGRERRTAPPSVSGLSAPAGR